MSMKLCISLVSLQTGSIRAASYSNSAIVPHNDFALAGDQDNQQAFEIFKQSVDDQRARYNEGLSAMQQATRERGQEHRDESEATRKTFDASLQMMKETYKEIGDRKDARRAKLEDEKKEKKLEKKEKKEKKDIERKEQLALQNQMFSGQNQMFSGQNTMLAGQNTMLAGQNPMLAGQNPMLAGQNPMLAGPYQQYGYQSYPGLVPLAPGQYAGGPQPPAGQIHPNHPAAQAQFASGQFSPGPEQPAPVHPGQPSGPTGSASSSGQFMAPSEEPVETPVLKTDAEGKISFKNWYNFFEADRKMGEKSALRNKFPDMVEPLHNALAQNVPKKDKIRFIFDLGETLGLLREGETVEKRLK